VLLPADLSAVTLRRLVNCERQSNYCQRRAFVFLLLEGEERWGHAYSRSSAEALDTRTKRTFTHETGSLLSTV